MRPHLLFAAFLLATGGDMQKMMEGARSGNMSPDEARRMAEELRKQYQK